MATDIEWADEVWNPTVGCSRVSAGCDHCYAMGVAHRNLSPRHRGLTKLRPKGSGRPGVDWNGEVRLVPEALGVPLRWRKPQRVFVNSMSDLFHERVPFPFIAAVFGVMAACPQHTFLVLTKRDPRPFFAWLDDEGSKYDLCRDSMPGALLHCAWMLCSDDTAENDYVADRADMMMPTATVFGRAWPLPNVHLGVSAEDQATWDERVPLLLDCPAAVRWVSAEPLLGPIDVARPIRWTAGGHEHQVCYPPHHLGWLVVGGESGPGARPFNIAWARSMVAQCQGAGVPVFVKQLGAQPFADDAWQSPRLHDRKGGDMAEWPDDLRVRELPGVPHA